MSPKTWRSYIAADHRSAINGYRNREIAASAASAMRNILRKWFPDKHLQFVVIDGSSAVIAVEILHLEDDKASIFPLKGEEPLDAVVVFVDDYCDHGTALRSAQKIVSRPLDAAIFIRSSGAERNFPDIVRRTTTLSRGAHA